mgnify:CR=1 FL=1
MSEETNKLLRVQANIKIKNTSSLNLQSVNLSDSIDSNSGLLASHRRLLKEELIKEQK